jgi:glutathione S-transferase
MILSQAGVEFEDIRTPLTVIPAIDCLPEEIKSKCRWGQVPLLEFDGGKRLVQSFAISRYLARKYKLVPEDPYQAALCDEYVDAVRDMFYALLPIYFEDESVKEKKLDEGVKNAQAKFCDKFEAIIKASGGDYLFGSSLTWADIWLAHWLDNFPRVLGRDVALGYDKLKNLQKSVFSQPRIKKWVENRPNTKL